MHWGFFSENVNMFDINVCHQFYYDNANNPANYTPSETFNSGKALDGIANNRVFPTAAVGILRTCI